MQSLQCKVCQKVTLADGSQVWVCKECGQEHQPEEGVAMMSQSTPPAPAQPQPVAPAAPVVTPPVATPNPADPTTT